MDPKSVRFNTRRCMRVITDTLVAAKFGYVEVPGPAFDTNKIEPLRDKAVDELKAATDQALGEPNSTLWPWWSPMNPTRTYDGTLEVAEATACLAVGYDWLRGSPLLLAPEKVRTRTALLKGLRRLEDFVAVRMISAQCSASCRATNTCTPACWSNWNAVISGTEIVAAIAIRDDLAGDDRSFVDSILERAPETLRTYLKLFSYSAAEPSRNGAFPEGATYLNFSLEYLALADAALGRSGGTLSGLNFAGTGVREAPSFALDMLSTSSSILKGPEGEATGLSINYSDGSSVVVPSLAVQSWFGLAHGKAENSAAAQYFGQASLTKSVLGEYGAYTMDALSVLWFKDHTPPWTPPSNGAKLYGDSSGHNNVAFLRRPISSNLSLYAMLKGGMAAETPHGHMDAGSFILEAFDRRWSFDLSHDSYSAPNYFALRGNIFPSRWDYLRTNNRGHNTLVIDGQLQDPTALAPVFLATENTASETAAVVNLSAVYRTQATNTRRRLALTNTGDFMIKDVITGAQVGSTITWQMIYCAQTNPIRGECYPKILDGRSIPNPIQVSATSRNEATIKEDIYTTENCGKPRRLEVKALTPSNALLVSEKLVAPDLQIPGRPTPEESTYEQADSIRKGKCFVLSTSVPAQHGSTTIEIKLTPKEDH